MAKNVDKANLLSHRPYKKQKIDSSIPVGTPLVKLNPSVLGVIYETLTVDVSITRPDIGPFSTSPAANPSTSVPMTLLRSETLAWKRFKQVLKDNDISICNDMSVREFEHSTVHDLFKVFTHFFDNVGNIIC